MTSGSPTEGARVSFFGGRRCLLGESPLWDGRSGRLWWVDIADHRVLAANADGALVCDRRFDTPVGCLGLAEGLELVAAAGDRFLRLDGEGEVVGASSPCPGIEGGRFNDGKVDREGRFVAGSMQVEPLAEAASVWRWDGGAPQRVATGMRLVNSTCFSPDGAWMYVSDCLEHVIRRYRYTDGTGPLGEPEAFIDTRALGSVPDGATTDEAGRLWVALVQAAAVGCFSPEGELLGVVETPIPFPSCPAFGGPDLRTLYVTTISDSGLRLRTDHPDGGRLLAVEGLDATGLPEPLWRPAHHGRD